MALLGFILSLGDRVNTSFVRNYEEVNELCYFILFGHFFLIREVQGAQGAFRFVFTEEKPLNREGLPE